MVDDTDATRVALFVDAEHLNREFFFVFVVLCSTTIGATTVAATAAATVGAGHLITHLKIE